jgi:hypothetical protein
VPVDEPESKRITCSATVRLATIISLVAIALAGCGGDDDDATTVEDRPASEAAALYEEISDLPDEEQIERVGAAWARPFAKGDERMCEYLHPDIAGGCSQYVESALTGSSRIQRSYARARVENVEINGRSAVTEFSNGEQVEFEKDPNDEWKIVRTSRAE